MRGIIRLVYTLAIGVAIVINIGCVEKKTYLHSSTPQVSRVETDSLSISVEPNKLEGSRLFSYFMLSMENRSTENIEIDWNRSGYVQNGNFEGRLYFKEIKPADIKTQTVPNTVVPAGSNLSMAIAPMSRVARSKLKEQNVFEGTGFYPGMLPAGENTVVMVFMKGSERMIQKLTVQIKKEVQTN